MDQMDGAIYGSTQTMSVQNQALVNAQLGNLLRPSGIANICCDQSETTGLNLWGKYFGSTGDVKSDGNTSGFDFSQSGVMVGGDGDIGANTRMGFLFSYLDSAMRMEGLNQKADILNYLFGFYCIRQTENGYWFSTANYGYDRYNTMRSVQFGTLTDRIDRDLTGSANGHQAGLRLERGFDFKTDCTLFQPFANVQYIHADTDRINEEGGNSLNLQIDASDYNSFRSEIGARYILFRNTFAENGQYRGGNLMIQGSWIHEYETTFGTVKATTDNLDLANYGTTSHYTVRGIDLGSDWTNLGVGANWTINRLTFFGGYDFLMNNRQTLNTGNAGLAFCW